MVKQPVFCIWWNSTECLHETVPYFPGSVSQADHDPRRP
jgi:hypothetical protein